MNIAVMIALIIFLVILLLILLKNSGRIKNMEKKISDVTDFKNEVLTMRKEISDRLSDVARTTGSSTQVMANVQKSLGGVEEATKRVVDLSKGLSDLQQILSPPKLRGNLGELFLAELLGQVLPKEVYELQYRFKTGDAVDAIIKAGARLVPVDAKFPLENFKRVIESNSDEEKNQNRKKFVSDVKKHIDDIASKYILPDEGTYDFALMYIPAENVYYEIITRDETAREEKGIFSYAINKRVIPVSPNSFYAYLQVIALGLKGMTLEKSAQQILMNLGRLETDVRKFREDFETVGKHIHDAQNRYSDAERKLDRLEDKLGTIEKPELTE